MNTPPKRRWLRRSAYSIHETLLLLVVDAGVLTYPPALLEWLKSQSLDGLAFAGNGELLWLERGRVVAKLVGRRGVSVAELVQRTAELWGLE